jgi:hypothetical protein
MTPREVQLEKQRYFYSRLARRLERRFKVNKFLSWFWFVMFVISVVEKF